MAVEVPADKVVDLRFRCRVQILELVHRLELNHIETVREDPIRLALQQVLALVRRDMRHSREHVRTVRGRALDAVSVVDSTFSCFVIDVEVLEVVVEID